MKRTIFIIVIIIIVLYFQYPYVNYVNNSYEIIQYDNPNKSVFESMSSEKKIAIFTNIPLELEYESIDYSSFTQEFLNTLKQTKIKTLTSNIIDNLNKIPTKKCNNIYEKCGKRIHCKSRIPMNSNNICKKCRWRKEDNNSHKSNDSCDSNINK